MSARGGRGNFRGGRGSSRGKVGLSSGGRPSFSGPPSSITELGEVLHSSEHELVCKSFLKDQVPYFNGRIFLENKEEIGKVDEILGPINTYFFSIKMNSGVKAESFNTGTKIFIDPQQLLPMSRFLPKQSSPKTTKKIGETSINKKRGGFNGSPGRGGQSRGVRGGKGFSRGASPRGFRGRGASS
ncbi:small nucleolar RNP protein [Cryptosporidium ubiquitum]|uniref:H/ACA ribonucleoprotein complex subunit n=1 Tax=Cryptosporidium ubiquitum TaxID=857276 RepID=A0A1J4MR25_9CRYT|nr:small nucleolar RNP protein [Cryptosporidium ubiquitum]OII75341.1 small nucleolar RNP protein [Cryptosporidium ubiquitum]